MWSNESCGTVNFEAPPLQSSEPPRTSLKGLDDTEVVMYTRRRSPEWILALPLQILAILSMHDQSISIMPASNSKPALFLQHGFVWCCLPFKDFFGKIAVWTHCHTTAISLSRVSTFHPPQFAAVVAVISFATLWSRAKHSKTGMHSLFLERIHESSMWENCSQFMHVFLHPGKMSLGTDSGVVHTFHTACSWGGCCLRRPMQDCDTLCCFCLFCIAILHCKGHCGTSQWQAIFNLELRLWVCLFAILCTSPRGYLD